MPPPPPDAAMATLSARGSAATKPALSYLDAFLAAAQDAYQPDFNPSGTVVLAVAENKLSHEHFLQLVRARGADEPPPESMGYDDMRGLPRLRDALAATLARTFMLGAAEAGAPPLAEELTVSSGAGAVIENVVFATCAPGDSVLIPAPYYPAFNNDLTVRVGAKPWPVKASAYNPAGAYVPTVRDLDEAAAAATAAGAPPRMLLLTHPHNPLGVVWPADAYAGIVKWGLKRGLHVVSDEVYALSIFDDAAQSEFVSAAELACREDVRACGDVDNLLHVIWAFSKDFSGSGLRVGCLWSRNAALNRSMHNLGYFCAVSNYVQNVLAAALEDAEGIDAYLVQNRRRLAAQAKLLCVGLEAAHVPFVQPTAGLFCWVDLSGSLLAQSVEGERALWQQLLEEKKLLLTPGADCHAPRHGWFRACFASVSEEAIEEATNRLGDFIRGEVRSFVEALP